MSGPLLRAAIIQNVMEEAANDRRLNANAPAAFILDDTDLTSSSHRFGLYQLSSRKVHDRPAWKHAHRDQWVASDKDGDWIMQTGKDLGESKGALMLKGPELPGHSRNVWSSMDGTSVPTIVVRALSVAQLAQHTRDEAQAAAMPLVIETSDSRLSREAQGQYAHAGKVNGQPAWKKGNYWITFSGGSDWWLQTEVAKGEAKGQAYLPGPSLPTQSNKKWKVSADGRFCPAPTIVCRSATLSEMASSSAASSSVASAPQGAKTEAQKLIAELREAEMTSSASRDYARAAACENQIEALNQLGERIAKLKALEARAAERREYEEAGHHSAEIAKLEAHELSDAMATARACLNGSATSSAGADVPMGVPVADVV